jgi:hypothetical protein
MNFRWILARKLAMVIPVMVMVALALLAIPAGAVNQTPAQPGLGDMHNAVPAVELPRVINYQGYLTNLDGSPVNGTLEMTFCLYETPEGGSPVWTETHPSVIVTNGLFNVLLGSINPLWAPNFTGERYLGITVGSDPEMTPRQRISSVAYAFRSGAANFANNADTLDDLDSAEFVAVAGDTMTGQLVLPENGLVAGTDQLVLTNGKVAIGTASPLIDCKLEVHGNLKDGIYGSGPTFGVYGYNDVSNSNGRLGNIFSGVHGAADYQGVYGVNTISNNHGVLGTPDEGVYGYHDSSGNYGRLGTGNDGVAGTSNTGYGSGVYGINTDAGYGVHGRNSVSGNYGYLGTTEAGVHGEDGGTGNYGRLGTESYGVYGKGEMGIFSSGVRGENSNGNYGMIGAALSGVVGYGNSYGVYGNGDIGIYGSGNIGADGYNDATSNHGYLGTANEGAYGTHYASGNFGQLGTSANGVYGENGNGNFGRLGNANSGVYGQESSTGNYGQLGTSSDGVAGTSNTDIGSGVYGLNNAAGSGVYGVNNAAGYGVYGKNNTSGNYGQVGTSNYGVYGRNNNTSNYGILGTINHGVYGWGNTVSDYDFYAGGPGTDYGPFTGAHEVKLDASFQQDFRQGLIVSVTGETQVRIEEGEISCSSTLPTVHLANTPNDKRIAGVIVSESPLPDDHWYQATEDERFGIVNALGDGRVWVTNINGNIEAGDYITSSTIPGYGQLQDDDFLHTYTLGKATEMVDWSQVTETVEFNGQTCKAYLIAVFYTSG